MSSDLTWSIAQADWQAAGFPARSLTFFPSLTVSLRGTVRADTRASVVARVNSMSDQTLSPLGQRLQALRDVKFPDAMNATVASKILHFCQAVQSAERYCRYVPDESAVLGDLDRLRDKLQGLSQDEEHERLQSDPDFVYMYSLKVKTKVSSLLVGSSG